VTGTKAKPLDAPTLADATPYEIHDVSIAYEDRERMDSILSSKMEKLVSDLGFSTPMELHSAFPHFMPDIKVFAADGVEVHGPTEFAALTADRFPVAFKIKLPKSPSAKKPDDAVGPESAETTGEGSETDKDAAKAEALELSQEEIAAREAAAKAAEEAEVARKAAEEAEVARKAAEAEEVFVAGLNKLIQLAGIKLAFLQPDPQKTKRYEDFGAKSPDTWTTHELPGDFADFEFSTDGDGRDEPEKRWGILAVVVPKGGERDITAEQADAFCSRWSELNSKAVGITEIPDSRASQFYPYVRWRCAVYPYVRWRCAVAAARWCPPTAYQRWVQYRAASLVAISTLIPGTPCSPPPIQRP